MVKGEYMKFYDLQTNKYSYYTTIEGLYEMLISGYCECGEGYDVLDKKDGKMKCKNCFKLSNFDSITEEEMRIEIEESEFRIEG